MNINLLIGLFLPAGMTIVLIIVVIQINMELKHVERRIRQVQKNISNSSL